MADSGDEGRVGGAATNDATDGGTSDQGYSSKRSKRFRFKGKNGKSTSEHHPRSRSASPSDRHHHRHRRHRHHHARHSVRKPSPRRSPVPDSETAFRQSLFDALADDEGAAFWEGVYGQPIHDFPNTYVGPEGELERMTDEEYTAYVRRRMWEKSQEGQEELRQARLQERRERQQAEDQEERTRNRNTRTPASERNVFDLELEASLQRGEKRKRDKAWKQRWEKYLQSWADLNATTENLKHTTTTSNPITFEDKQGNAQPQVHIRNKIAWPVETGKRKDITPSEVERFFKKATAATASSSPDNSHNDDDGDMTSDPKLALITALKTERVRWHPDKIQHRYSRLGIIDEATLKAVTEVFQIVDDMWNKERGRR